MQEKNQNSFKSFSLNIRQQLVTFNKPAILGILNITPDSFYDGGRYTQTEAILQHAHEIINQGADIIDIGAVSTRPGAQLLDPQEETNRLVPIIKLIRQEIPEAIISVDTCYSLPAEESIKTGADIINDISGGQFDDKMLSTIAQLQVPYILMHTRGLPGQMQQNTSYSDIIHDLALYFSERLETLYRLGAIDIILDPGFGFAKTTEQNFEILRRFNELCVLFKEPILSALSRKSMIYKTLGCTPNEALNGTTVLNTLSLANGAKLLRVHDVAQAVEVVNLYQATMNQ